MTVKLFKFRKMFQNIFDCRNIFIHCLSSVNLFALRKAIDFWLLNKEKRAHLNLLWNVFEHMKWSESIREIIMMRRDLDFRRVEALMRESVIMHWKKMIFFIIMIRSSFDYKNLVLWIKQALLNITRFIRMTVTKATERSNFWNTMFIVIIEEITVDVEIFISITTLIQKSTRLCYHRQSCCHIYFSVCA